MATLISGNPGSGKSTLTAELQRRGFRAVDADLVPGLAAWLDEDGAVVGDASLRPTPELLVDCYWGWSARLLDEVLDDLGSEGALLGVAVNQWEFVDRFDDLVLLELDGTTQRDRVRSRDPLFQQQIHDGLPILQARMIELGATRIDATRPRGAVADAVAEILAEHRRRRDA